MMNDVVKKEIDRILQDRAGSVALSESYVVAPKKFELKTEMLGGRTKRARQEEFELGTQALNQVSAQLDTADRQAANNYFSDLRNYKRDESYNTTLSFLRAAHFKNISSLDSVVTADSLAFMRLERDFGSFDDWQRDFIACAMSSRSGFVVTAYSLTLKRYLNHIIDADMSGLPLESIYIIALDVSEGAYYRDFANDKRTYVAAMMKEFRWEEVESRVKKAEKLARVYDAQ